VYYSGGFQSDIKLYRRYELAKVVNCPCGEKITGDADDELVKLVQEHGKEVHQEDVSRDDAMAMAQPAD
jgi:predicted small metal-binding protein